MKVQFRGLDKLDAKIKKQSERVSGVPREAMQEALLYVHSQVPPYPPKPADSTYDRTMTLGRSVTSLAGRAAGALSRVETVGGGAVGYIGTNIVYAPYVIDKERQARVHRGRWWVLQDVVEKARSKILEIFKRYVGKALE